MVRKRPTPEEIVSKLRQLEMLQSQGMSVACAVRQIGVTQQTLPVASALRRGWTLSSSSV